MNCTINDLQLSFDSNGKLRTTIGRVTGFDVNKAYVLASFLRDPNFQKYLLEKITQEDIIKNTTVDFKNFTEKDYVNIKQNKLGAILNLYYIEKYHSVNNSKTNKGMGRLNGFTSATAKETAKNHVAFILRREYNKEINKDKASRRSAAQIIDSVNAELLKDFYEKYVNPFVELIVSSSNYPKEAKEYAAKYLQIKSEIEAINKLIKSNQILANNYNEQIKKLKDIEEINKLKQQLKELYSTQVTKLNRGKQLTIDRYIIAQNLVNLHSSNYDGKVKDRIRNFANLVAQSRGDMNGWYFQVFHSKIMIDAYKFFNSLGDVENAVNSLEINEDEIVDIEDDQGINQYAKHWEDKFYKSAEESVNAALRIELANLPVLKEPYNPSAKEQAIDTNNELGVATYMNPQFVIAQIHSSSKVYSVEAFIRSLDELSKTKSNLYGLGTLVDKMKRNKAYANFVYVNFAKPIFNKTIVTVNNLSEEAGIKFDYSNPNIAPLTELVFRMSNKLKTTYDITYSAKDRQDLIEIQKKLINNTLNRDKDIESVYNILTNYFPNFDKKSFTQYIDNISKGDFKTEFNAFISYLSDIIKGVGELKIKINNELIEHQQKQQKIFDDYLNDVRYAELKKLALPEKPEREPFKSKDDDLSADTYKAIIALANAFINFTDSKIRLTSSNAEGNTAADIGKNCYISRFFEQILAEDESNANKGLENLLSYITQGVDDGETNQYANNPLFFGVRDENGVEIVPGMFRRTANGTVINKHAKDILKYSLFDGVRNNENNAGAIYASMSKLDFFLTQYLAFINSTEEIVNGTKTKNIGKVNSAVYSMRIGSDAPKIFFVRAPKYNDAQVKYALYNHVIDELNMFVNALNNIFIDEGGQLKTIKSIDKLFGRAYFDEKVATQIRKNKGTDYTSALINEKGELVGNMFNFGRLFELNGYGADKTNVYSADKAIKSMLSLYGGVDANSLFIKEDDGRLSINPARISKDSTNQIIIHENNRFKLNLSDTDKVALHNIVRTWCTIFLNESKNEIVSYASMLTEYKIANDFSTLDNFLLNYVNMNINYDDLFEGDSKFYKDPRDFLKRSKESQAGGDAYAGYDMLEDPRTPIHEIEDEIIQIKTSKNGVPSDYVIPIYKNGEIVNDKLRARTGFRGVTIYNTVTPSIHADAIEEKLVNLLIKDGLSEEKAKERAKSIADGYRKPTKVNDAQSYITIEEFIRRRYSDGTLSTYQDILAQLLDDNIGAENIDLTEINARIQVQKNFYYDKVFDKDTGEYNPRQIKNAEFVLIPKLLPAGSQLRRVYDWMKANDIGQLNTAETSKAAKKHIFTIWDEQTGEFNEDFEKEFDSTYIEEYSYKYLYKQQDVPEHMKDAKNKAGTQFIKKIIDNIDRLDKSNEELNKVAEGFLKAYSANITDDFYTFIDDLGWVYDNNTGTFYNKEYATTDNNGNKLPKEVIDANRTRLNLDKFYERFREEAVRLGMDSNFMDYLILTEAGQPIMPNFMNNTSSKLESIAQAMWNSAITRQTFPGWHCAQITDVGYDQKLNFDSETGVMEVYLPRWSNLIPKSKNAEEDAEILKQIHDEGLDIQIGYRIPTEGKQSISVLRVVGFVNDALGSTIVVPAEWVTQTGSDFDVDSIYGISWEMYQRKSKDGKITLHKIPFEERKVTDEQLYISWVKERIDAKTNRSIFEEEIKDSLNELKKELNSLAFDKIDKLRNDLYTQLPNSCKKIIQDVNDANKISKDGKKVVNIKAAYPIIINKLTAKAENLNEEEAAIVQEYIDYTKAILEILNAQEGHKVYDVEEYKSKKAKIVEQLVKEVQDKKFKEIESKAIAEGLISFEEFKYLDHVKKLTRKARNNYIINAAITIMNDSSSREEQYSRSHFEDITNANKLIDDLTGDSLKKISPYNPLSQLEYFDDAMSGARMKARSVNWDTTFSKFNRVKAVLNAENEIEVILDDEEYDIETIKNSYEIKEVTQSENIAEEESNSVKEIDSKPKSSIKLNRLGWSTNNRNITGAICTPYIAQTTAHHLDAIKEGSIKNVNELTFGVYKLLVGLGLDYEHSIGFIRQPIITSLVENYKLTKSVYFKDTNDPIKMTMALIARRLRIKNKFKKEITVNDTLKNIIECLIADHNFAETFKGMYGIDISEMSHEDVLKIKIPLDKKLLFDRLNSNASEIFSLEEKCVIDFGILLMFNQFKTIADKIEDNIKVLSVDKIGNKTEIRETRLILDLLDELRKNNIIVVNGVNLISSIFPINDKGKIEDESSAYQYIATVLKYVTETSTKTNTQIFITENEDFVEAEKYIESIIGKKLSVKEYKEYKKYYITYLYNRIKKLISPLTVNERGEIFIDNDVVNKTKENETYWNNERTRIVGYGIVKGPEINIANINDPKEPELDEYKKLTPVQKVLFIQKYFNDEQGIFKFIKPTLVSGKDIAIKGISRQYMSFDDQIENIEDVYQLFINSFSNHNPLIKLAAIDLVKYAFIAEGFNFKSGYITKLIVNSSLYESKENGGLDIINGGNNTITEEIKDIPSILRSGELQDLYVRSHSDIVKIYRFGPLAKQTIDENTGALYTKNPNWTDTLLSHTDGDKLITLIDKTDDAHLHGIIRKLRLHSSAKYIRISVPDRAEHYTTILYKVVKKLVSEELEYDLEHYYANKDDFKDMDVIGIDEQERKIKLLKQNTVFYLLPLDKLENNETFEYSYNQNYMQYFSQEYYLEKIQYLFEELQRTTRELRNAEVNTIDKIKPSFTQEEVTMITDENLLMQLYNSGDAKLKASVRKFINDIEDYNANVNKSGNYSSRIINNSYKALASYFPADTKVIQAITLSNGENIKIAISRFDLSKNNRRANFIRQYNGQLKLTDTDPKHKFDHVIYTMKENGTPPNFAELYDITIVPEFNDEVYSDTDEITSTTDLDLSARRADIDDVASSLIKDISYVYRRDELASGRRFLKEVRKLNLDRNSLVSIQTNRDPIYKNAARYYRNVANAILAKLNNYQVNEITSFAIDDPQLYDYLVEHDELFPDVAKTILDAISFGSRIKEILNLNIATEDEELAKSVNTIINAIKEVSQNNKLKRAMDNIFNIYFKKYSNNPEIIKDIIKLRETYGDTDQIYRWIADATEIANSEVQVILKQVYSLFSKAEMFDVKRNVDEWKKALKEITDMPGDLDISKFIDNNRGILKQDFNEQFIIDKEKVEDDFREAESELIIAFRDAYAKGDPIFANIKGAVKKYIIAKWNRDNFLYKHTEQQIVPEYYREDLLNRKEAIESVGDLYFEYLSLRMQLYNTNFMPTETAEAAKERKERVQRRINSLLSSFDATDSLKELEKQDKINHLMKIIERKAVIREKYFDVQPYDGFMEEYKKYNDYLISYNKNHSDESLEQKLENPKYKEAYDWIRTNGRIQFTSEAKTKLNEAYKVLLGRNSLISKKRKEAFKRISGLIDENGVLDATKFTDEQLEALKKEEQSDLSRMYEDSLGEGILIKQVPNNLPLFKKRKNNVADGYILNELKGEDGALQMELIAKINSILSKVIDRDTGKIIAPLLFNNSIVTDAERDELAKLYSQLRKLKRSKTTKKKQDIYIEDVNRDDYLTMYAYAQTTLKGTRQYDQFLAIFQELDEDGNVSPNKLLYGFRIPTEKYEDVERTKAIKFLNDNLEYVPTEYYIKARQEAAAKGPEEFDKWFKLNHIYDHYNHKYKPLNVWLESKPKADSYLAKEYKYTPTGDNMESSVKEEYINNEINNKRYGRNSKGYRRFSHNYKKGNPKYDSNLELTEKEKKLRDLIMSTMRKFANTNATKRFVEEGYLPRERTTHVNGRWALEQGLGLMGLSWHSGRDSDIFRTEIDYSSDFEVDMPMLHLLKVKGSPEYLPYPSREGKSEEDYQKELKEIKEENKKIQATILATDNANMNTNWLDVMEDFIKTATIHNARVAAKPYIYLLLEDLKDNRAYMLKGMWNRQVVKSGDNAAFETEGYRTVSQKHTRELVHNMARRLLYDQHHENSLPRNIANFLQNMTSAKYMVFNLYGGIANVAIGKSGILSEELAGEYFGFNEFLKAEGEYLAHSVSIISSLYSDKANDLTTALMKKFNIVNVDDMIQLVGNAKDLDTRIENIRSAMYSFQSIGEHYMQNSVLLAMLKSNRLYTDRFGNRRIGDFKDYTWDIEQEAMEAVLSDYEYLATNYNIFRKNLKYETQTKYDIYSGRKNINRMFLRSLKNSRNENYRGLYKEIVDKYIAKRKELFETKKLEFKSNPTVESIFKYEDGYAVIDSEIMNKFNEAGVNKVGDLEKLLAEFKEKVKSVNRYIHGWYDKNAAGMIESKWYGSIFMQYHKHLPIGILKRYRRRGFHSEFRGAKERGFYQTLIDFMGTEFIDYNDRVKAKTNEGTDIALASIQVIFESIINSVLDYQTNKELLAPWEKANLSRLGGGLGGALIACLVTMALYGLYDDDELKNDRFKASLLYLADRLYADNTMYTPIGLVTEYRTAWSSPIASANGPSDLIKAMTIIPQYLFDPEFSRTYQTGLYKGKDKLQVLLRRNLPGVRPYDRIMNITRNNEYYKIGQSQLGINIAKNFGETLNEE